METVKYQMILSILIMLLLGSCTVEIPAIIGGEDGEDEVGSACGDALLQDGEECDDGNDIESDACTNACTLPVCGDAILQDDEQCDNGLGNDDADFCTTQCMWAICGDGHVHEGVEFCDAGPLNGQIGSECNQYCAPISCGNGVIEPDEQCDDGNFIFTDGCTNCHYPTCGDGFVEEGVEECDDGNDILTDGCTDECMLPACGDDIINNGEECDDGDNSNNNWCLNTCILNTCGDGYLLEGFEQCDIDSFYCVDCQFPFCGDGIKQDWEQCDEGPANGMSFCNLDCTIDPG